MIVALLAAWGAGLFLSLRYLVRYERTPGQIQTAPLAWPAGVPDTGSADTPVLVVALHPRCSCSRASLNELQAAARSFHTPFNALLLVYQPQQGDSAWQNNTLYREAQQNLHARLVTDIDGRFAASFGARTSGETLLYSPRDQSGTRRLLYAGGVTGARGIDGANPGSNALIHAFNLHQAQPGRPVYGCGLSSFTPQLPRLHPTHTAAIGIPR